MGRILIGLGLMLLSLKLIKEATVPLAQASLFHELLAAVGSEPALAFIVGAVLAWLFHSTLAVILLIASFLANGSLEVAGALALHSGHQFRWRASGGHIDARHADRRRGACRSPICCAGACGHRGGGLH